jgi:hypothetical protein
MKRVQPFAPGVIDGPYHAPRWVGFRLLDALARFVLQRAGWLVAISVVVGLLLGAKP